MASPTSAASSTCSSRARTRKRAWPPSWRSVSPTSKADSRPARPMSVGGPDRPVGGLAVRPPTGVELRPAARDDLDAVLGLLAQRTSVEAPELDGQAATERWEAFLSSIDSSPFLAVADHEAVGLLLLSFRRRLNFATWEAWVPELVVADDHRRRGIGRALLRVAIEEWRLRGAHRLSVEVAPGEEPRCALLSGMGFEESFK